MSTKRAKLIIIILIVVVALIGVSAYFLVAGIDSDKTKEASSNSTSEQDKNKGSETSAEPVSPPKTPSVTEKVATTSANGQTYVQYVFIGNNGTTVQTGIQKAGAQAFMVDIVKAGCGSQKKCNYLLWESRAAYESGKNSVTGTAATIANANKGTMLGLLSNNNVFYYYGVTGDGKSNSQTKLNTSTWKYSE